MKRPHFALPEIYDESLSYYDVLRKLIKSIHAIVDNLNKIPEQIANEAKAREQADSTLQINIDNEAMARQEADNELRELISTSGGGVTEAQLNEEVTARQQADTVLDGKISELKGDLSEYVEYANFTLNGFLDTSGVIRNGKSFVTDYIEILANKIKYKLYGSENIGLVCFYDTDKNFISSIKDVSNQYVTGEVEVPNNAKYYRASAWNSGEISYCLQTSSSKNILENTKAIEENRKAIEENTKAIEEKLSSYYLVTEYPNLGYLNKNGSFAENHKAGVVSDYIECKGANTIKFRLAEVDNALMIAFYDENKKFISGINGLAENLKMVETEVDIPMGTYYFRSAMWNVKGESYYTKFSYSLLEISATVTENKKRIDEIESNLVNGYKYGDSLMKPFEFNGKTAIAFGDSITVGIANEGSGNIGAGSNSYINKFATHVGLTLTNRAVSGSTITYADGETLESLYTKILAMTETPDFIIISGGTNDYNQGKELGSFGDTDNTKFYGALYQICEKLKTDNSNATVIFITPINVTKDFNGIDRILLNNYRNAIYEVATSYGFNVVDGTDLVPVTGQTGYDDTIINHVDGCHPTIKGHGLYAKNLCGKLL